MAAGTTQLRPGWLDEQLAEEWVEPATTTAAAAVAVAVAKPQLDYGSIEIRDYERAQQSDEDEEAQQHRSQYEGSAIVYGTMVVRGSPLTATAAAAAPSSVNNRWINTQSRDVNQHGPQQNTTTTTIASGSLVFATAGRQKQQQQQSQLAWAAAALRNKGDLLAQTTPRTPHHLEALFVAPARQGPDDDKARHAQLEDARVPSAENPSPIEEDSVAIASAVQAVSPEPASPQLHGKAHVIQYRKAGIRPAEAHLPSYAS